MARVVLRLTCSWRCICQPQSTLQPITVAGRARYELPSKQRKTSRIRLVVDADPGYLRQTDRLELLIIASLEVTCTKRPASTLDDDRRWFRIHPPSTSSSEDTVHEIDYHARPLWLYGKRPAPTRA